MGSLWAKDVCEAWLSQENYECGENKWNKFADLLDKCDYFTGCGKKQNLDFCAVGMCWGAYVSVKDPDYEEDPEAAKWAAHYFLYQSDSCDTAAVVKYLYQFFADNNATTDNPERGDIAIFQRSNGVMYHCGGVTGWDWDNDKIYITEFNTEGGKVKTHEYSFNDIGKKIKCFCRPRYDGWSPDEDEDNDYSSLPGPDPEPTPEPTPDPEPEKPVDDYEVTNVSSWLNVRNGCGKEYPVVDKLYNGDKVKVYETKDGWARISNDMDLWVSMDYLTRV